jgi:hypothetical protein
MARKVISTTSILSNDRKDLNDNFTELYSIDATLSSDKVPYTGATSTVNLGSEKLITEEVESVGDLTIDCGAEKTIVLEEVVWDDLRILPSSFDFPGVNDPTIIDYQPGGSGVTFKVYEFQKNDYALFSCQIPHGYKEGENIKCHIHWTPGTRGNEEINAVVAWRLDYSWTNIGATFPASSNISMADTVTGTDHYHEISPDTAMTGIGKHISSMLLCKISRETSGDTWAGTASGSLPILLEVDFHIPISTIGSRTTTTK